MNVGILALQGDVPEHRAAVASIVGAPHVALVRDVRGLEGVEALFLPGGEIPRSFGCCRKPSYGNRSRTAFGTDFRSSRRVPV